MRMLKWNRGLRLLGAAAVGVLALARGASASADVTTELPGSVVVWPKVVWDGTRDTIIQLTNTGNPPAHVHCFYVNAAPAVNSCAPATSRNPPQWLETDFDLWLTKQQPTHWVVSEGRRTNFGDSGDGAGFDPGLIPPVPTCFTGELKCIQTDDAGFPTPGNKLKGEATLRSRTGDVSKYNAIAFLANPGLTSDDIGSDLQLTLTDNNPDGAYSACPDRLLLNHFTYGSPDLAFNNQIGTCPGNACLGGTSDGDACTSNSGCPGGLCLSACPVTTELTLVPCQQNFETQTAGKVTVQFDITNEFEEHFSASTTVNCWLNDSLAAMTANQVVFSTIGTISAFTRIHPNPGNGGVIGVAEEFRKDSNTVGRGAAAAFNLNIEGNRFDAQTDDQGRPVAGGVIDHIIIPAEFE